jgi:hypothetical protein
MGSCSRTLNKMSCRYGSNTLGSFLSISAQAHAAYLQIESLDSTGAKTSLYKVGDTIYLNGTGLAASKTYNVSVVRNVDPWISGLSIPQRVDGSALNVTTDNSGSFAQTPVWPNAVNGVYDIILDVNGNGKYDPGTDALDDNDIVGTGGFLVVHEYFLGSIAALATCLAAYGAFKKRPTF